MAATRYFHTNYWEPDYFSATWWPADPGTDRIGQIAATVSLDTPGQNYWQENYWAAAYWSSSFWGGATASRFYGSFDVAGTRTGTIEVTLEDTINAITGPVVQVENVDITVNVAVPWVDYDISGVAGTIADTLAAFTSDAAGTFIASGGIVGTIAVTLEANPSNFDGTHVAPANITGTIGATLDDDLADLVGQTLGVGSAIGVVGVTLEDMPVDISGTMSPGNKTGTISDTLGDYTSQITGVFADSGVVIGSIGVTLDDTTSSIRGVSIGDKIITAQSEHRKTAHNVVSVGARQGRRSAGTRRGRRKA